MAEKKTGAEEAGVVEVEFADLEGSELFVPFEKVTASSQARLMGRMAKVFGGSESASMEDADFDALADLLDYVRDRFTVDREAFDALTSGRGGFERATDLVLGFTHELGKGES